MAEALTASDIATATKLSAGPVQEGMRSEVRRDNNLQPVMVLSVENMNCGGCMRKVEDALARLPGVTSARANLSAKRVTISIAEDADVSAPSIIEALARAGFKAGEVRGTVEDAAKSAERDLLFRVAVAGFAAANVMLLSVSVWSGQASGDMSPSVEALFHWLSALIALPAVAYAGQPFFRSALTALSAWRMNMDVPISLGVLLATGMSVYETLAGDGHVYFDAAVMLLFFLLIGRFLDARMRVRAAGAASNLLALQAMAADVIQADGTVRRLPAHALEPGMQIQVAPGERIAVDGTIVSGRSDIDNALITGESTPHGAGVGDKVFAGAINLSGRLVVRADAVEQGTVLAEITRLMVTAEQGRGAYVRLADRSARIYAPAVHILGAATFAGWMLAGYGWLPALTAAVAVLIITCPCALALAVPAVQIAATSRLFGRGVLVKAADGLERLASCDTIVFDKTGTLTSGQPTLIAPSAEARAVMADAASLAAASRHPYSRALVYAASDAGLAVRPAEGVQEHPGQGLSLETAAGEMRLGSGEFCGAAAAAGDDAALWFKPVAGSPVAFRFEDTIKPDAVAQIARLKEAGYHIEILSGDRPSSVADIARGLGVTAWRARCTPAEKVKRVELLKSAGRKVLMVGDGLNDAPALASGTASMSPSDAADISQTSADCIFQGGNLAPVVEALAVAQDSERMAVENFAIALAYNALFVPMAVIGWVTPLLAAIAMSASSLAVTGNALRLRGRKLRLDRRPAEPMNRDIQARRHVP